MSSLQYAIQKASEIPYRRGFQRHYCIILDKRGRKLAESANSYSKTSPKMLRAARKVGNDQAIYWHAECKAIYSLRNPEKAYKLIVVRIDAKNQPVNSAPCIICSTLMKSIGIKVVEHTV